MNAKTLKLLVVLAILAALLAWWLSADDVRRGVPAEVGQPLVPGLADRLERLQAFRLSAKEPLVTIERGAEGGGFTVRERHGYPADLGKLRGYLLRLGEARLVEAKTSNPERFAELGLGDPAAEQGGATRLELVFSDGEYALLLGRYNGQGSGTFVRRPGENQSWLVSGDLTLEREAVRWIARDLIDLPSGKIQRLELKRPDGEIIRAAKAREEDPHFAVENLPPGRELSGEWAPTGLAGLLSALQADDVQPAAEHPVPEDALTLQYDTFDGRRYAMRLWKKDDAHYLSIAAELLPESEEASAEAGASSSAETAPPASASGEAPAAAGAGSEVAQGAGGEEAAGASAPAEGEKKSEEAKPTPPAKPSREELAREVDRFNDQVRGWVYRIPTWKYSAVDKRMEDLLKPKEG
jgi:hypothetical protein